MKRLNGNRFERRSSLGRKARIRTAGASVLSVVLMGGLAFMQFPTSVFAEEITDYSETYDDSYVAGTSEQDGSSDEWGSGENSYVGDETGYGDDYSDGQYGEDLSAQEGLSDAGGGLWRRRLCRRRDHIWG